MFTRRILITHPITGEPLRVCRGPSPSGACPLAGRDGVVPCAGLLIGPVDGDPEHWPLPIPEGYRHCDVMWQEMAQSSLRKAENAREQWQAGLERETVRIRALAADGDPRYRTMKEGDLRMTALWRWRMTNEAQHLRRSEERHERRADTYLAFIRFRRTAGSAEPHRGAAVAG